MTYRELYEKASQMLDKKKCDHHWKMDRSLVAGKNEDVDAVEVVRCKDCKHWTDENGGLCDIWDYYISNEEFFCGCGERRENDGSD